MLKQLRRKPRVFVGGKPVFMTTNVLGYFKLYVGHAELSEGRGLAPVPGNTPGQTMFGVTVRPDWQGDCRHRSRLFRSREVAMMYIESLSAAPVPAIKERKNTRSAACVMVDRWMDDRSPARSTVVLARQVDPRCRIYAYLNTGRKRFVFSDCSQAVFSGGGLQVTK